MSSVVLIYFHFFFFFFFFFFQAEDGIRDWSVTGVQTCALPILCECLTGGPPYPATTPESLLARALVGGPPLVAGPLGDLLRSALSADGGDRPATAAAFHDALAEVEWCATEPLLA